MQQPSQHVSRKAKIIVLVFIAAFVLQLMAFNAWHASVLGPYPEDEALRPAVLVLGFFWLYGLVMAWLIHHGRIINVRKLRRRPPPRMSPEALLLL